MVWLWPRPGSTVLLVDDQRREFKRKFASALVALRAESQHGSQKVFAGLVPISEATYRRWESLDEPHLPDVWQIRRLCELLCCEAGDLLDPPDFSERERQLAARAARAGARGVHRGVRGG